VASTPLRFTRSNRARAVLAAAALAIALPASAVGAQGHPNPAEAFVTVLGTAPGGTFAVPLINSGDVFDGETFEGLPDGIGVMPVGNGKRYVDLFVNFEQSHVPFGTTSTSVFADFEDSSVLRARLDLKTQQIVQLDEVLPPSAGYIRFCSAFMAGPAEGFNSYTLFVNEESNDRLPVVAGAQYGADSAIAPLRQAGYTVWLDAATGEYKPIPGMGRMNHENQVIVPGGWDDIVSVSGDDTFSAPGSQLYMYKASSPGAFKQDKGSLLAFQVTATGADGASPLADPYDEFNDANDYLEILAGQTWSGRFIEVPAGIAKGTEDYPDGSSNAPQESLEAWSNDNNVFQFVRVEDIAYDPDDPSTIYFADTGTTRLKESGTTGRLFRAGSSGYPYWDSDGRIFKMTFNADDPTVVDEFSFIAQGRLREQQNSTTIVVTDNGAGYTGTPASALINPDNVAISHDSIMVQEDGSSGNEVWRYAFGGGWTKIASTLATQPADVETSGIVDMSAWMGAGWWALDVQSHGVHVGALDPTSLVPADWYTWTTAPIPPGGAQYRYHREGGQLLLLYVPGS